MDRSGGSLRWVRARCFQGLGPGLILAGLAACVSYQAEPLPPPEQVVSRGLPAMKRIQVAAKTFVHPLLGPLEIRLEDGLSPDEAAVLAVLSNPGLKGVRDAHGETLAQLVGAGLLENPVVSAEVLHPYGSGSSREVDQTVFSARMSLQSFLGRAERVAAGSARLKSVDLGIAWQEWQVAQAARLVTLRTALVEQRQELVRQELRVRRQLAQLLQTARDRGQVAWPVVAREQVSVVELERFLGDLESQDLDLRSRLGLLLGLPPALKLKLQVVVGEGHPPPPLRPVANLVRRAASSRLDLKALRLGYEAQEARLHQAVLAQFPAPSIGLSRERNESAVRFLGGFVSLGLPIFNHQQARIQGEVATRTRLRHEYEARILKVRGEVARLVAEDTLLADRIGRARANRQRLAALVRVQEEAARRGEASRLAREDLRAALFKQRLELGRLSQKRAEIRVALATAVGSNPEQVQKEDEKP